MNMKRMKSKKCYRCYKNANDLKIVTDNKNTVAYLLGENTYICQNCDYFLKVGNSIREANIKVVHQK